MTSFFVKSAAVEDDDPTVISLSDIMLLVDDLLLARDEDLLSSMPTLEYRPSANDENEVLALLLE